jgi:hypothetical protein
MKIVQLVLIVALVFLLAVGVQALILRRIGLNPFNFAQYSLFGWIIQIIYFTIAICAGILLWDDKCN